MRHHARYIVLIALAVAAVQIGVLASMIMGRAAILRNGEEVVLQMVPVDPRDLLRGDYVTISYNISNISTGIVEPGTEVAENGPHVVFVRLRRQEDGIWSAVAARYGEAPAARKEAGDVDMSGTTYSRPDGSSTTLSVSYGIERFYVPEGQGKPIETGVGERSFTMRVAVAADGAAQIKALYDGSDLIFSEPLY